MARLLGTAALVLVALGWGRAARGQAQTDTHLGQLEMGLFGGYAYLVQGGRTESDGGGGGIYVRCGITESFAIKASGLWTVHGSQSKDDKARESLQLISGTVGLTYAVDWGRFSPKLEGGIGLLHRTEGDRQETDPAFSVGLGIDYQSYPWLTIGAAFYYYALLSDPSELPVYVSIGPRMAFRVP